VKNLLLLLLGFLLIGLIWAPLFLNQSIEIDPEVLPVTEPTQIRLNILASAGVVALLGLYAWTQRHRR